MLHKLFKDIKWQGELSAGSWSMALEQAPDGMFDKASARIGGQKYKGLAFPLKNLIVGEEEAQA